MNTENTGVVKKNTDLLDQIQKLTAEKSKTDAMLLEREDENEKCSEDLARCNNDLVTVKSFYGAYAEKLSRMKSELNLAFPNNLNEVNFSILEEDGRLIVRIPNKILYKTGSAEFGPAALDIIQKLSLVFRENKNLQILIEGHTDDTPLKAGGKYEDNWDLSVARAVNVVRKFELYGVSAKRLTVAGRGYFAPISRLDSKEARTINRRTEIIIRPQIHELLKMLEELQ